MNLPHDDSSNVRLTKSDFLLFLEAPRHLWAKQRGLIEAAPSEFERHLAAEGSRVEALGREYLETVLLPQHPGARLLWQETFSDHAFEIRVDGLVQGPGPGNEVLYEIKSSTGVDKDIVYDVVFQAAILEKHFNVNQYFVLHVNKEYTRSGELDLADLFIAEDVTDEVQKNMLKVKDLREEALQIAHLSNPEDAAHCLSPKDCPCPGICHPDLPEFSIYDIPNLSPKKKRQLLENGVRAAADIPPSFDLNPKQRLVAGLARSGREHFDQMAVAAELEKLVFPLYFLDYETCICAVPPFDGYHPQQQAVFQYSLHKLESRSAPPMHFEHLSEEAGDPALPLLYRLQADIGEDGSVLVWNKSFEMSRNREMAGLHPQFALFLERLNERIYDLGDIINLGYYLHPGFKGSWSIKNVLPVMAPELIYEGLPICKGDQASLAWWKMTFGQVNRSEREVIRQDLLNYCQLDTRAMIEIYRKFAQMIG